MQCYRFSISWPRIMPQGLASNINQKGIDYYNALINEVVNNGLTPVVSSPFFFSLCAFIIFNTLKRNNNFLYHLLYVSTTQHFAYYYICEF